MTPSAPWGDRSSTIAAGFDPDSFGERAVRRRRHDAGAGRTVDLPVFRVLLDPGSASPTVPAVGAVVLSCAPGGGLGLAARFDGLLAGERERLCRAVHEAVTTVPDALTVVDEGWAGVLVPGGPRRPASRLVLRTSDADLLRAWLRLRYPETSTPQDTPVPTVLARHLARIDGVGPGVDHWGELYLEARATRRPDRIADTLTLTWRAHWTGVSYRVGAGGVGLLSDLHQRRIMLGDTVFRVRGLPEWERAGAAAALRLPAAAAVTWVMSPLDRVLDSFRDGPPVVDDDTPQDA